MKLIRFGKPGNEKPGIQLDKGQKIDVSAFGLDYDEVFFGFEGPKKLREWLSLNQENCPKISENVRLGPPICRPSKIVCVGLNYAKHAQESGMEVPSEPVLFFKASSAIIRLGGRTGNRYWSQSQLCGGGKCYESYSRICITQ